MVEPGFGPGRPRAEKSVTLGRVVATPGVLREVPPEELLHALDRHQRGDWGEVDAHDKAQNDFSLEHGLRVLSAYSTSAGVSFWVITEADRSVTTALLPEEY